MKFITGRSLVRGRNGMVAAAHPLAASAGADILRKGGNAFDAIVATAAALNVCEPMMSGLAGNGMAAMYIAKEQRVRTLDFTPPVPLEFDASTTSRAEIEAGPKAVGIPGSLAGWVKINETYGTKSLAELFAEPIRLAKDGFPVSDLYLTTTNYGLSKQLPDVWKANYVDSLRQYAAGEILTQPALANTLQAIAREGSDYLYNGPLAHAIVEYLRRQGGVISMHDLQNVSADFTEPMSVTYRGMRIHSSPPPSEAFQFLLTLSLLDGVDLASKPKFGADHLDAILRSVRIAAEARITNNNKPREQIEALFAPENVQRMRNLLESSRSLPGRTEQWADGPLPEADWAKQNTTSFSAADAEGNLICVTQTLGLAFGSGHVVPGTGVCLSNYLSWGDLNASSPNLLRPGSRWASVVAPTIGTINGRGVLALGTPGSYGILQSLPQVYVNHLEYGLDLQAAIEAPRVRLWDGTRVEIESRVLEEVVVELRRRGHDVELTLPATLVTGGFHAVAYDPETGAIAGAADPRRDGAAMPA